MDRLTVMWKTSSFYPSDYEGDSPERFEFREMWKTPDGSPKYLVSREIGMWVGVDICVET